MSSAVLSAVAPVSTQYITVVLKAKSDYTNFLNLDSLKYSVL